MIFVVDLLKYVFVFESYDRITLAGKDQRKAFSISKYDNHITYIGLTIFFKFLPRKTMTF